MHPVVAFASLLMIAVGAGASGCLNMWWDADIDALMTRTRKRPIPAGKVTPDEALAFGLDPRRGLGDRCSALIGNWLAAGLLAFTILFYVVIYSMWLKRSTPQNIVIGGAAGALPPDRRPGGGDRRRRSRTASSSSPSSSCGRRRISGPWRSSSPAITPAPASR